MDEGKTERTTHPWVAEAANGVRFGVDLGPAPNGQASVEWAQMVEELGFDSFWLRDHPARAPEDPFTYLAAIAVSTRRVRLGTMGACALYRHPVLLARVAADVDRLSGGRLVLGLGAGWDAKEFAQMGLPFPPPGERLDALEETVKIVRGVWGDEPFTFEGRHFRVEGVRVDPGPAQRPRVPLLLAGAGERRTLRMVARYADASNVEGKADVGAPTPEALAAKYAVLRRHCGELGRPYESVLRTYFSVPVVLAETAAALAAKLDAMPAWFQTHPSRVVGSPREAVGSFRAFVDAGAQYFVCFVADAESARLLAERVMPEVRGG
jgi:probable F420-dependent oxidoreductase